MPFIWGHNEQDLQLRSVPTRLAARWHACKHRALLDIQILWSIEALAERFSLVSLVIAAMLDGMNAAENAWGWVPNWFFGGHHTEISSFE